MTRKKLSKIWLANLASNFIFLFFLDGGVDMVICITSHLLNRAAAMWINAYKLKDHKATDL